LHGFARLLHGGKDGLLFLGHALPPHDPYNGIENPAVMVSVSARGLRAASWAYADQIEAAADIR